MKPLTMATSSASAPIFMRRSCVRRASASGPVRAPAIRWEWEVSVMKDPVVQAPSIPIESGPAIVAGHRHPPYSLKNSDTASSPSM